MFLQQMFLSAEFHPEYREQADFYSCLVQLTFFTLKKKKKRKKNFPAQCGQRGIKLTWKMVYMTHVSGRLCECSATLKILMPHLLMSSRSCQRSDRHVIGGLHFDIQSLTRDRGQRSPLTAVPPGPS